MNHCCDLMVIGSGIAGLTCALNAANHAKILLLSKGSIDEANTSKAQGGIAAVVTPNDSFQLHIQDTLRVGVGLCNEEIVRLCVEKSPEVIQWLNSMGVEFDKQNDKSCLAVGREGGHSARRIVHVSDYTGKAIHSALITAALAHPNIEVAQHNIAIDLITTDKLGEQGEKRCVGAYVLDVKTGKIQALGASGVVLATGGGGKVYLYTTNVDSATGDGVAMAWRAGAKIANMEFFQFHPTCLYHPYAKNFLISEAVRGEGGLLIDAKGKRFMPAYHPDAELAPRDVVARAIDAELKKSGDDCVFLDLTHLNSGFIENRFPQIFQFCYKLGIDIRSEPIPVVPAAHYQCGGVLVDKWGWTGIPGLWACGEVACTGLHGANRLASNSLLESVVFGKRVAHNALKWLQEVPKKPVQLPQWTTGHAKDPDESVVITQNWDEIRRFMWNYVGLVRSTNRLERARKRLLLVRDEVYNDYWSFILSKDLIELRNLADVAYLILEMAWMRRESRGLHLNTDYPRRDDVHWKRDTILWRAKSLR